MTKVKDFKCKDCSVDTLDIAEYYMVSNCVWAEAGGGKGMLCVGCLEKRIGYRLHAKDFTSASINRIGFQSDRLKSRMV